MDFEKELLDAFDRIVHEDFPNPQHIGCAGRQVLLKLAQQPPDAQLSRLLDSGVFPCPRYNVSRRLSECRRGLRWIADKQNPEG